MQLLFESKHLDNDLPSFVNDDSQMDAADSKKNGLSHTNESQIYVSVGTHLTFLVNKSTILARVIQGMRTLKFFEKLINSIEIVKLFNAVKTLIWGCRFVADTDGSPVEKYDQCVDMELLLNLL